MTLAKVLLAVKDQNLSREWAEALRSRDFEVLEAATFLEAKKRVLERSPDLAVIDIQVSREDENPLSMGRSIAPDIPTIIVMESRDPDVMRDSFRRKPRYAPPVSDVIHQEEGIEAVVKALQRALTPRVFVAHGHDTAARDEVARLLRAIQLRPIVLSEEAEAGRTIIEKIEDYSDVAFAIILLTPDDVGGTGSSDLKKRARQNVIFELGYFFAKLGRKKVVALCKGEDLEMPSNYAGILYLPMDSTGGWKRRLADEMKAAGFDIDLDQILRA